MSSQDGGGAKVAVVLHEGVVGGASLSVLRMVPLLEERGWSFSFWGPPDRALSDYLLERGHRLQGLPRNLAFSLVALRQPPGPLPRLTSLPRYFQQFDAFLRKEAVQLVHANTLYTLPEALVARARRLPALLHLHEMVPESYKGAVTSQLARRARLEVVAVSEASAARYARGAQPPRVVHEGAVIPRPPRRREARERVTVGSVAVISRRKGPDLFVEAARRVLAEEEGVDFRLVGMPTDPLDERWGREVLRDANAVGVEHLPSVDVPREMAKWDIFVLPARQDPFPIVVLEAMASELPVVGTKVDGIAEQVTAETGIVCPPEDPRSLADAILRLARDPALRARLGAAGRRRVEAHFSVERQADEMHEAYKATCAALSGSERT
ncbi:MAG: glycosyltransferase family 4 protein [Pyrinomonadaceae bacterium]|nr:glycosyltransferase family 4 protein [Pyrinomonadaceae bacterium]